MYNRKSSKLEQLHGIIIIQLHNNTDTQYLYQNKYEFYYFYCRLLFNKNILDIKFPIFPLY